MRAVIFVPGASDRDIASCLGHCDRFGYELGALTTTWPAVVELLRAQAAEVVVVASRTALPPDRTPRIEAADEMRPAPIPRQRRERPMALDR